MDLIRNASAEDARDCAVLLCDSIRELCVPDHKNDERVLAQWISNKTTANLEHWILDQNSAVYVVEREDSICGVGGFLKSGEVTLNYVAPRCRFSGVSRLLLTHLEKERRDRGVKRAGLTSTGTAHQFYEASGWCDKGEPKRSLGMIGYPMEKDL